MGNTARSEYRRGRLGVGYSGEKLSSPKSKVKRKDLGLGKKVFERRKKKEEFGG